MHLVGGGPGDPGLITARGLQIDALVNDAGFGETGYFSDTDMDTELAIIQVNVAALVRLIQLIPSL